MRKYTCFAAIAGVTGVGLGAFGAHGLKGILTNHGTVQAWETAVLYHLIHAVAVLSVSRLCEPNRVPNTRPHSTWDTRACACWCIGIILFSGSLYGLSLGAPRWLGPITPLGGIAFILGWIFIGFAALKTPTTDK